MEDRPVLVFSSLLHVEGHMAQQLLEGIGINAQLRGGHLSGLGGLIPFQESQVEVWVPAKDMREAQRALGIEVSPVAHGGLSIAQVSESHGGLSPAAEGDVRGALSEPGGTAAPIESCPACGEDWEPGFEVCWSCQHALPDS